MEKQTVDTTQDKKQEMVGAEGTKPEKVVDDELEKTIEVVVQKLEQTTLSGEDDEKASVDVDETNLLPFAGFAFKPSKDDILVETFEQVGSNQCFKCNLKVTSDIMLLCQCGYFICKNCFLAGCYCAEKKNGESEEKKENAACAYEIVETTNQEIDLDGQIFQLECIISKPATN